MPIGNPPKHFSPKVTMRKVCVFCAAVVLFSIVLVLSPSLARADMLRGSAVMNTGATIWNEGTSQSVLVTPMKVDNLTTDQTLMAFCGDFTVSTSSAFGSSTGEAYGSHSLFSPTLTLYSDLQKSMINDLFSYTYATAFDFDGNVINSVYAQALQLVVWEILMETGPSMNILSGSFYAAGLGSGVAAATNSWLDALSGTSTWESLGLTTAVDYDLTVYVAEGGVHASQTLISITGPPPPVVPEPGTMLILGIGAVAAAPYLRRKKRTVA